MDKKHFAKYVSENLHISPKHANLIIDVFTENVEQAINEGHSVSLDKFGAFIPTKRITNKHTLVNDKKFLPGKLLKDKVAS